VKSILKYIILPLAGLMLSSALECDLVLAAPINNGRGRNYAGKALRNSSAGITGTKGTFSAGTNDLVNTVTPGLPASGSPNNPVPFINKDVWLLMVDPVSPVYVCWVEAMVAKTNFITNYYQQVNTLPPGVTLPGNSYTGYWIATQRPNSTNPATMVLYSEYPYGTNNSPNAASGGSVEIVQGTSNSQWLVKVNGVNALTLNGFSCSKYVNGVPTVYTPPGGTEAQFGIEANDTSPLITFTNGTRITNMQTKQGAGSYTTVPTSPLVNLDANNVNWTSTYSLNGQLTINK
jgi:hypothetical protein